MLLEKRQLKDVIDAVRHYQMYNVSINSEKYSELEEIIEKLQNFYRLECNE